jgi:hypothetical protein
MRRWVVAALFLGGCGSYIGSGHAPQVATPRPVNLRIDVQGNEKKPVERALSWILRDNGLIRRVSGTDGAPVYVDAQIERVSAVIAGTDVTLQFHVRGDGFDEQQTFTLTGLTSNVNDAEEKLVTEATVWALGRAAANVGVPVRADATPASPTAAVAAPALAAEAPTEPATTKRKRRR